MVEVRGITMVKNAIELPGAKNARELGGFAVNGGRIKKGVLLRAGTLGKAPEMVEKLEKSYKVRAIVDFRMDGERNASPDPEVHGARNIHLPVIEFEDYIQQLGDPQLAKRYMSQQMGRDEMIEVAYQHGLIGPEVYPFFLLGERGIKAYRSFFEILLNPEEGAVLWHCTDGKDRTGLASALLLVALGASKETIFEDYLMTNAYNAKVIEPIRSRLKELETAPEKIDAMVFASGGAIEGYLIRAFEVLEEKYNGAEGYLTKALGLTEDDFEILRKKYIDTAPEM